MVDEYIGICRSVLFFLKKTLIFISNEVMSQLSEEIGRLTNGLVPALRRLSGPFKISVILVRLLGEGVCNETRGV